MPAERVLRIADAADDIAPPAANARRVPMTPVRDRARRHEVFGLLALSAAGWLGLALAAYDARGGRDWCGPAGTLTSETLVALLGTASVLIPWSLFVLSIRLFRRSVRPFSALHALGTLAIIATIATTMHLAFGERPLLGHLPAGGLVGLTLAETLRAVIGDAGAHVVALTALLVALVVRTRLSVVSLASSARHAGVAGSLAARDGIVTVAAAWRKARDEDREPPVDATAPADIVPDAPADIEARTASALQPVFARAHAPDPDFAGPEITMDVQPMFRAVDSEPGESRAGLMALLGDATDSSPPPSAFGSSPITNGNTALAVDAALPVPKRRPRARRIVATVSSQDATSSPSPLEIDPMEDEVDDTTPDEPEVETTPAPVLQIVSHAEEIKAAMRAQPETPSASASVAPGPMALPATSLLTIAPRDGVQVDEAQLRASADRLIKTLKDYTIEGRVVEIHPGPVVTTFEFVPAAGTKLSKIARLSDDIAMSLEATTVRIVAPIPGKGRVGFEIPNAKRQMVSFRELLETDAFRSLNGALPVALGKDVVGAPFFADLATMPHLIVAGSTGSGKSVGLNVMLTSLLYKRAPEDVRMIMIDPKQVELAVYDGIPHMLLPVVTDMKKAALALRWVVDEMERRYTMFAQTGSRNITTFNERVAKALDEGVPLKGYVAPPRKDVDGEPAAPKPPSKLPYILVVVDEFADLMMVAGKEVESAVARLAQKARAAGIHVILATQRPSVDVITGVIKANFPSRVAFKVSQKVDSRTILDQQGAEHLLGKGDMLILPPGSSDLRRVHCAYASEDEVQAVTDHWRKQGEPTYDEEILRPRDEEEADGDEPDIKVPMEKYEKAVALVLGSGRCSVSWVQRQLAVGYNVAARMVEKMERDGIVSAPKGPGKDREVLA